MTHGVRTPADVVDRIVYLHDVSKLDWAMIGRRLGMKAETARRNYNRRKYGSDAPPADPTTK